MTPLIAEGGARPRTGRHKVAELQRLSGVELAQDGQEAREIDPRVIINQHDPGGRKGGEEASFEMREGREEAVLGRQRLHTVIWAVVGEVAEE